MVDKSRLEQEAHKVFSDRIFSRCARLFRIIFVLTISEDSALRGCLLLSKAEFNVVIYSYRIFAKMKTRKSLRTLN